MGAVELVNKPDRLSLLSLIPGFASQNPLVTLLNLSLFLSHFS